MSLESDNDLELYPHAELELRAQSRVASREDAAERSADARRVLDDGPARAPPGRLWPVACDCVSCGSSGVPLTVRFRVGYVLRCL